ncbi:hypothetical protein ACFFIY_02290 [Bhargavaea ullalensis]|uniref:Uncharacterized protein n=1 Tax=Bhargavaea ullalensis TaxID=1265685 RepID=A0ABV2GB76_9BACL
MATKSKSDRVWMILSVAAIAAAVASLLYCSGFISDFLDRRGAGEAIAMLRQMMKGSAL